MDITDVRVRIIPKGEKKLKAVVSVIIDDEFAVHDIKVIEGAEGHFIVMPSRKTPEGNFRDIAHPIRTEVRDRLSETVLNAYYRALAEYRG